jgi:hypothetical protein
MRFLSREPAVVEFATLGKIVFPENETHTPP